MSQVKLPSWRPGHTRETIEVFLDAAEGLPVERRVAVFDIDGTLWSEKPRYTMMDFLLAELRSAVTADPALGQRPEYRAALDSDQTAIGRLGPVNVALALLELHAGMTPEAYETRVRSWFTEARQPDRSVPISQTRYRPMLELIGELRARHFDVYLVTGSGIEFIRAISSEFFGVKPEGVVGSQVDYEFAREGGAPTLRRTKVIVGNPNEGSAKVCNIQRLLGRRPILAVGNGAGDAQMLMYAAASEGPSLALLLDHDDAEREYQYADASAHTDWTAVSMRDDWATVFADT